MKVCTCCYHPEVQDDNIIADNIIEVPDDTPIMLRGFFKVKTISHKILENAGLRWNPRWDIDSWCTPQGELIYGVYSITKEQKTSFSKDE